MNVKKTLVGVSIVIITFLFGCSSLNVTTTVSERADFFTYRTFNWLPMKQALPLEEAQPEEIWRIAKESIEKGMIQHGFEHFASTDVDFFLTFQLVDQEKIRGVTLNRLAYKPLWGNYGTQSLSTQYYTKGSMIVDIIDGKTKEMVWRGTVTGVVGDDPHEIKNKLREAADILAEEFKHVVNP